MDRQQIFQLVGYMESLITLPFLYCIEYYFYKRMLGFKHRMREFVIYSLFMIMMNFLASRILPQPLSIVLSDTIELLWIIYLCNGNLFIKFYAVIIKEIGLLLISLSFFVFDFDLIPLISDFNAIARKNVLISFSRNILIESITFCLLIVFLRAICNFLNFKENRLNLYHSLYLLIPCLSIYSFGVIFYNVQIITINHKKYYLPFIFPHLFYLLPLISFALLASMLITAYIFRRMLEGEDQRQQNLIIDQQLKLQLNHTRNIEGLYSGVRTVMHDMNNHLSCLKNLAEKNNTQEIKQYLYSMGETLGRLDFKIKTGHPISDAVVNEKYTIAIAEGIEFICDFMLPQDTLLEPVDLCTILSNVLDNAIEACERITDNEITKSIVLKSYFRDLYLIIEISNTTTDKILYGKNGIITSKADKNTHGLGISIVEATARKYNGTVDIVEEKNKFIMNIMLQIK